MCEGNPNCGCAHIAGGGIRPFRGMRLAAGPAAAESIAPSGAQSKSYAVAQNDEKAAQFTLMALLHKTLTRIERRLYDASTPVDERLSLATAPGGLTYTIQPDYEIRVRIESISASLPVGITSATLKVGQDTITLYSGAATIVQTLVSMPNLGLQLDRDDDRILTFTGAPSSGFFIALAGHAMETWGDR